MDATQQPLTKQQILKPDGPFAAALSNLIQQKIRAESDPEQSKIFARIRRNNLYYRGMQYLSMTRLPDGTIDYKPVSAGGMSPSSQNQQDEMYDNILPMFRGDVRKWCGVLGVRSPNAKCEPRTVGDDHQIRLARLGDRAISHLKSTWRADNLQRYLAYSLAVNGTTFGYVNFVADEKKYGATDVPRLEVKQVPAGEAYFVCTNCGTENPVMTAQQTLRCSYDGFPLGPEDYREPEMVPGIVQTSVDRYANGAVELQLATGATVKTPYYISDLDHCPWLWYEYLVNRYELIHTFAPAVKQGDNSPEAQFRRELRAHLMSDATGGSMSGGASTAEIRRTANTLSSPSGQPFERKSLASFGQYFLSPGMLEAMSDDDDKSGALRDQLQSRYSKGLHLLYVSGKLADVREACIPERWSICQPDTGDFIYRDAVFDDYIQGVDVINDTLNLLIQQAEKSNALTAFDPDVLDPDTLRNKQVQTGEFIQCKRGSGAQLAASFFRLPSSEVSEALIKFMEFYIGHNRENVGIMPAIFGGGEADEAVGVAKIRRNQSLMQLNVPWNYMRDFWSSCYQNGIRLLARYSNGKLVMNRGGVIELEELDGIWDLQQGGIDIQCEEAMPMTWAQRQEQVESMLARPPQAWSVLGLTDPNGMPLPANVEQLQDAVGLPDWQVPGLAARERLLDIVGQLVKGEPVDQPPMPPGVDPMGNLIPPGPPPPPQPSIAPNTTMFNAPFAVTVLQDWLVSDKGREAETGALPEQSPRGFENVLAYTQAWILIATPPPPPMPLGGPGPGPEGPPPDGQSPTAPPPPDQKGVAAPPPPDQAGMAAPPPNQMPTGPAPGTIQ